MFEFFTGRNHRTTTKEQSLEHAWECEQQHDFVRFMVNTGLKRDAQASEVVEGKATNKTHSGNQLGGKMGVGYSQEHAWSRTSIETLAQPTAPYGYSPT
jgi:hypothetical protein